MNIEERNLLLERISLIEKINLSEKVAIYIGNQEDINAISIGKYPVKKFISFFNRSIKQLKVELESENFYFYPIQGHAQPIANINLSNVLIEVLNLLNQNQIPSLESYINQLITYEYYFGFWHISKYRIHNISAKEIKERTIALDLITQKIENSLENLSNKLSDMDRFKKESNDFISQKQNEIIQITNNLAKSTQETKSISELLLQSQKLNQQIDNILEQQKLKLTDIATLFEVEKSRFEDYQKRESELEDKIKAHLVDTEDRLVESASQLNFINSKRDDIVRLTGMAADGSLGSKFDERQNKLNKSIKFWRWAVPIITILAIIYIFIIFKFFKPTQDINVWILLGISIIKTTPALFVLFWVFRQYVKERNIQEEYAFKSAVAMTITAYSDLLDGKDSGTNSSRQKMIVDAIKEVHRLPRILDEKDNSSDGNVAKNAQETLKQILDLVKEIKK